MGTIQSTVEPEPRLASSPAPADLSHLPKGVARSLKPRCGARRATNGEPCRQLAGQRTDHPGTGRCWKHGGATKSGTMSAQRTMAAHAAVTLGLPVNIDPHSALLAEVHRTAGHVAWIGARIQAIEPSALVWGASEKEYTAFENPDGTPASADGGPPLTRTVKVKEGPGIQIWMELYQKERKHLVEVCRIAISCGIAERQVKLAEEQGRIIARVLTGVLTQLGIDPTTETARLAMRQQLALASGAPIEAEVVP